MKGKMRKLILVMPISDRIKKWLMIKLGLILKPTEDDIKWAKNWGCQQ